MITCSKPGCGRAGAVVLAYDYAARRAMLFDPGDERPPPHLYALCGRCAERLSMPRGWTLDDRRDRPPLFAPEFPDATAASR
ncbi:MAG TPA: DUF3499 family protein [Actinomycetota bacterium]|nr:DUF3499 family protein [Actinomycetota bacterium]